MSFFEALGLVSEILGESVTRPEKKNSWLTGVCVFLLLLGVVACFFILQSVPLLSPVVFVSVFFLAGILGSVILLLSLFAIGLTGSYKPKEFLLMVTTLAVWTVFLSMFVNLEPVEESRRTVYGQLSDTSPHFAVILITKDGKSETMRVPLTNLEKAKNGDALKVEIVKGRLGFAYVRLVEPLRRQVSFNRPSHHP